MATRLKINDRILVTVSIKKQKIITLVSGCQYQDLRGTCLVANDLRHFIIDGTTIQKDDRLLVVDNLCRTH